VPVLLLLSLLQALVAAIATATTTRNIALLMAPPRAWVPKPEIEHARVKMGVTRIAISPNGNRLGSPS
jgi:hypothetical protein